MSAETTPEPEQMPIGPRWVGMPVHVVSFGNPSGLPCVPGQWLGQQQDGRSWVAGALGGSKPCRHHRPGGGDGPRLEYGTWHHAETCEIVEPVSWENDVGDNIPP